MVINMSEAALIKSYISAKEYKNATEFGVDIRRRLDSRFQTELKNHLDYLKTKDLLER
jgi:hypothetical protein